MSVEAVFKRDRAVIGSGVVAASLIAWVYMYYMATDAGHTAHFAHPAHPHLHPWGLGDLALLFVMWTVMMVGMMLPTASRVILVFATTSRRQREARRPYAPTAVFVGGYLAVWTAYSVLATVLQWGLHAAALLTPAMESASPVFGAAVLLVAGAFQWTRLKYSCLTHCRSPMSFLLSGWREGLSGAFLMGVRHGAYCVGCCWAIMALMFVTGVMSVFWAAVLTAFLLVEKIAPGGRHVGQAAGTLLMGMGGWMLWGALGPP